jgi:creatinine amidohydrolase
MKLKIAFLSMTILSLAFTPLLSQEPVDKKLPFHYGELTAPDFVKAVELSDGICLLPAGIIEKHGPHLPLTTDMILSREIASRAARQEYAIVFPEFYFGQIFEAKHQPGTIAYSPELVWNILEETCDELARNGIKKIVIVNGHGGNNHLFAYFCQTRLAEKKDYAVVLFSPDDRKVNKEIGEMRTTDYGGHADEVETSEIFVVRPDLVHAERASSQSGRDQQRMDIPYGFAGIFWYASYPNHYAGDGSSPNKAIGELSLNSQAKQLAGLIKYLKTDDTLNLLQDRFYEQSGHPVATEQ